MPDRSSLARVLTALTLTLPLLANAQTSPPPLTAVERAQREADRVFSVIKFHTIRSKPPVEAASKPARPPSPPVQRAAQAARPATDTAHAAEATMPAPEPAPAISAVANEMAGVATAPVSPAVVALPAAASLDEPVSASLAGEAAPEADEPEETPLRLQSFVAPALSPALQATLGAGERHVRVKLTVEADGRVSQAEAAAGVPRRLARPAVDALLQWQFAPLPQARTAEVEIAFRRD